MITDKLIDKLTSQFRIETEITETENTVSLTTRSYLGTRLLYTHSLPLDKLLDIAVARARDADGCRKDIT